MKHHDAPWRTMKPHEAPWRTQKKSTGGPKSGAPGPPWPSQNNQPSCLIPKSDRKRGREEGESAVCGGGGGGARAARARCVHANARGAHARVVELERDPERDEDRQHTTPEQCMSPQQPHRLYRGGADKYRSVHRSRDHQPPLLASAARRPKPPPPPSLTNE